MLKFYLETVCIYFIVYIATGILLKKEFVKARDKLRKELKINTKLYGTIKTTFMYLIASFIPLIRLILILTKMYMIIDTDKYIKMIKEKQELENSNNENNK